VRKILREYLRMKQFSAGIIPELRIDKLNTGACECRFHYGIKEKTFFFKSYHRKSTAKAALIPTMKEELHK
jgi:hypothetical protein